MRILNTNAENNKKISRFRLPGFRSGSLAKKIIACVYYCFVFFNVIVNGFRTALQMDFQGGADVCLFALFMIFALAAFLAPVIIVGISDYYDIHGIKLVLAVVALMSVCMTCAMFVSSYFSDSLKGIDVEISDPVNESESGDNREIENELVEENLKSDEKSVDSSAE